MKWRTEISIPRIGVKIDYATSITMLGSCFTDEVGQRMKSQLFDVDVNPLGTLFNPISIADAITDAIRQREFTKDEFFEVDGTWRTLRRHSRQSLADCNATIDLLNRNQEAAKCRILSADLMIITFGSAIVHRHIPSGCVAANCHKLPSNLFSVEPLSVNDITTRWHELLDNLFRINPKLNVIFTVSPVRHIGYGLERDRLSKSTLIVAINELVNERVHYFPSYEIVVDDLRDYRWYADDMVHPSTPAVNYVYDIFRQAIMTPETIALADRWGKLTRRLDHRHSSPEAEAAFREQTIGMAKSLSGGNSSMFQRFTALQQ